MPDEFEKSEGCNTHEILSDNILCCAETGRVVAVFYNDYDLNNVMEKLAENEKLNDRLKWAYCKEIGADSITGLDCCDDYKQWLKTINT